METEVRLHLRGTSDKSQIHVWQSLRQIANCDIKKKKRKTNRTQTLTLGTTSKKGTALLVNATKFQYILKSKLQ